MVAEIPCHAVKPPSAAAHQPGDPQRHLRPELRARAASCNTSGPAEWELVGSGRPALPRGRASRERITFATGSLLKDGEKRTAACTRPTPGLPMGRLPPWAQATDGQSHGTPTASPKESCKIPSRWHRPRRLPLKQRFSKLRGGHGNQVSIWPRTCCYRPTPGLSFPICKLRGCFLTHVLRFDSLFTFQKAFSTGDHNLQTIFTGSHPTSKMLERQEKKKKIQALLHTVSYHR